VGLREPRGEAVAQRVPEGLRGAVAEADWQREAGGVAVALPAAPEGVSAAELAGGEEAVAVVQALAVAVADCVPLVEEDREREEECVPTAVAVGVEDWQDVLDGVPVAVAVEVTVEDAETAEVGEP
jgi:hypothetical protein